MAGVVQPSLSRSTTVPRDISHARRFGHEYPELRSRRGSKKSSIGAGFRLVETCVLNQQKGDEFLRPGAAQARRLQN